MSISLSFNANQDRKYTLAVLEQLYALEAVEDADAVQAVIDAPEDIAHDLDTAISNAHKKVRESVDKAKTVDAATLAAEALKVPNEDALYHVASLHVAKAWQEARTLIDGIVQTVPDKVNAIYDALIAQVPDVEAAAHHDAADTALADDQGQEFLILLGMADTYKRVSDAVYKLRTLNALPDTRSDRDAWSWDYKTPTSAWLDSGEEFHDASGSEHEQLIRELKRGPYLPANEDEANAILAEYQPIRQKKIDDRVRDAAPERERIADVHRGVGDLITNAERAIANTGGTV